MRRFLTFLIAAIATAATANAEMIFSHDFENAPNPGAAVSGVADLGSPSVGSLAFSGLPFGGIGGTRPAFALGHNPNGLANMTQPAANSVEFDAIVDPVNFSFPETKVADAGSGDLLFAEFDAPGRFAGPGESTEISFVWASFGNNNTAQFKHQFVRGLDSAGREVFELLLVSGSGAAIRQVYARDADDDSITLTDANNGQPEGILLANEFGFNLNGTNVAGGRPSGGYTVSITLENGMVTYDIGASGGAFTNTAANGAPLPVNSAATEVTRLEFSSVWNASVDGQNKGYWLDDVHASTVPEPVGALLAVVAATAALGRNRPNR